MKIKIARKDGSTIIGKKKSLMFTISSDLEQLDYALKELKDGNTSVSYTHLRAHET